MKDISKLCVDVINDYEITSADRETLRCLLNCCFPNYFTQREYFKQTPKFRYLVWDDKRLVAQMGIEDRIISIDGKSTRIFGVIDLCVELTYRSNLIATSLLNRLETLGRRFNFDFIILFADDHRLYHKNGYISVDNTCKWLAIEEHISIGVFRDKLADSFMIKKIGAKSWSTGEVDLLGYLF